MSSNAPGQFLGYTIQFPRMLLRLLQMKVGEAVGIEVYGDIATIGPKGVVLAEEDKSSIGKNPLTDNSENLWKTFYNWIRLILDGKLSEDKTRFILYANRPVDSPLVNQFHAVQTLEEAASATEAARKMKSDSETLKKNLDSVLGQNWELFQKILIRFELETSDSSQDIYVDISNALREKYLPDEYLEWVGDQLAGWLQKNVIEKISNNEPAIVTFDEFRQAANAIYSRVRNKELIDFALKHLPSESAIKENAISRPTYVQQIEIIDHEEDEILEAVSDYLRATFNRAQWIEKEIIGESDIKDFEGRLLTHHTGSSRMIRLTEKESSEEIRGHKLLLNCQDHQAALANQTPPNKTISGTYHLLADKCQLGWHPRWKELIQTNEMSSEQEAK